MCILFNAANKITENHFNYTMVVIRQVHRYRCIVETKLNIALRTGNTGSQGKYTSRVFDARPRCSRRKTARPGLLQTTTGISRPYYVCEIAVVV